MTKQEALQDLDSTSCRPCGGAKGKRKSFCHRCFNNLPWKLKVALYQRVGQGYEEAYAEAVEFLGKTAGEGARK